MRVAIGVAAPAPSPAQPAAAALSVVQPLACILQFERSSCLFVSGLIAWLCCCVAGGFGKVVANVTLRKPATVFFEVSCGRYCRSHDPLLNPIVDPYDS